MVEDTCKTKRINVCLNTTLNLKERSFPPGTKTEGWFTNFCILVGFDLPRYFVASYIIDKVLILQDAGMQEQNEPGHTCLLDTGIELARCSSHSDSLMQELTKTLHFRNSTSHFFKSPSSSSTSSSFSLSFSLSMLTCTVAWMCCCACITFAISAARKFVLRYVWRLNLKGSDIMYKNPTRSCHY